MDTSPPLASLQRLFHAHVLSGGTTDAGSVHDLIVADARGSAVQRVGIYVDAYRLRLTEALTTDYPALRTVLGVPEFERLCAAYIKAHPSTTPSIRWLGRHLPDFLRSTREYGARPVLAELALFEWKQGETFDSPDVDTVGIEQVAAIPGQFWPGMRLLVHPSVRRMDLRSNAPDIVKAVAAGTRRPAAVLAADPTGWLMWRDEALDIRWRSMNDDEIAAFNAVKDHRSFADICEMLCEFVDPEQAPMRAASLLKRWVTERLICDIETGSG